MKGHSPIRFSMSYAQGLAEYDFIVGWNNRNIRRKVP